MSSVLNLSVCDLRAFVAFISISLSLFSCYFIWKAGFICNLSANLLEKTLAFSFSLSGGIVSLSGDMCDRADLIDRYPRALNILILSIFCLYFSVIGFTIGANLLGDNFLGDILFGNFCT